MRALIVEDEFLTAMHIETLLEDHGIASVGIAADKQEALALAEQAPDLAIVDLNLRDGPTGKIIATHLARRGISILFVTANPGEIGEERRYAIDVLSKPLEESQLSRTLAAARAMRKTGSALYDR